MKRFYVDVTVAARDDGWQVMLDRRAVRTASGREQRVPSPALAEALAAEWRDQGDEIDPARFILRDQADYAIDCVAPDRAGAIGKLVAFAETDTLCYRAAPEEALYRRQLEQWDPLLEGVEQRLGVRFVRTSGVLHRPQPAETLAALRTHLATLDDFSLAALHALAALAASLAVALAAAEPGADPDALWAAANLEEDWQVEHWGEDADAARVRARRKGDFLAAVRFLGLLGAA